MGKGLSNRQSERGNRVKPLSTGNEILHTKLDRVEQRSRQDRGTVFNNLGYLINKEMLQECFDSLEGTKAVGTDGINKEAYRKNLANNLEELSNFSYVFCLKRNLIRNFSYGKLPARHGASVVLHDKATLIGACIRYDSSQHRRYLQTVVNEPGIIK